MRTWEKWYWSICLFIPAILSFIVLVGSGEKGFHWTKTVNGVYSKGYWSKPEAFGYLVGIPLAVVFGLWLLIKAVSWLIRKK
jgi:hypothetical protein